MAEMVKRTQIALQNIQETQRRTAERWNIKAVDRAFENGDLVMIRKYPVTNKENYTHKKLLSTWHGQSFQRRKGRNSEHKKYKTIQNIAKME